MKAIRTKAAAALVALLGLFSLSVAADDLQDVLARGELRHLGVFYANFVTAAGDGFDVEIVRGFARHLGVRYRLVDSDFPAVMRDLLGREIVHSGDQVTLAGDYPIRGDLIAAGFTILPWRERVVLYSEPTFPSQVLLVGPADSPVMPIRGSARLADDIARTKALIAGQSLLVMLKTCLDPANYGLTGLGLDLRPYTRSSNLNEMVPALLAGGADLTLLDLPDVVIDLQKWAGRIKVIGPISAEQKMAAAFRPSGRALRDAFNDYLRQIKADGSFGLLVKRYYPGVLDYFPEFLAAR
ncbi:MAG: transporter substrate-binding domain-containing protein [Rhodospirillaceae bacterium]